MHDKLHKWLVNQANRYKVLKFLSEKKGFEIDKNFDSIIDIERPLFCTEPLTHSETVTGPNNITATLTAPPGSKINNFTILPENSSNSVSL